MESEEAVKEKFEEGPIVNHFDAAKLISEAQQKIVQNIAVNSLKYDLIYSGILALIVSSQILPAPWGSFLIGFSLLLLAILVNWWKETSGVWLSGLKPTKARWVAIAIGIICAVLMIFSIKLRQDGYSVWFGAPIFVLGLLTGFVGSRIWRRVFEKEVANQDAQ